MSIHNMMFNGMSGLNSMSSNMAMLGENIANVNTVSYKNVRTVFQNVLTSSQERFGETGNGSTVDSISKDFRNGSFETTTRVTDLALSGQGFFMLRDPLESETLYGRDGQFRLRELPDSPEGTFNLMTPEGRYVQGLNLGSVVNPGQSPDDIGDILLRGISLPKATETVKLALNLENPPRPPEKQTPPLFAGWDGAATPPLAEDQYSYQTKIEAFDDQGRAFDLNIYFDQTASGDEWEFLVTHDPGLDRRLLNDGGRYNDGETPEKGAGALLYGKLIFDQTGELRDLAAWNVPLDGELVPDEESRLTFDPTSSLYSFSYNLGSEADLSATLDFGTTFDTEGLAAPYNPLRTTNYAVQSTVIYKGQDGFAPGKLQDLSIKPDGTIVGHYSNGQQIVQAQVMLADHTNYQGLIPTSGNAYKANDQAGELVIGTGDNGTFGKILSNSLEISNVDLAREFVDLNMTQRIFQANSKSITTADEIFDTLIRLK